MENRPGKRALAGAKASARTGAIAFLLAGVIAVMIVACDDAGVVAKDEAADPAAPQLNSDVPAAPLSDRLEAQFLEATVHICLESWLVDDGERGYTIVYSDGYATVVDGHYLITHNHHGIPVGWPGDEAAADVFTRLIVYDHQERLVDTLSLQKFMVAWEDPYTLVLFYVGDKPTPFGTSGLRPEQVACGAEMQPAPKDEVLQVNLRNGQLILQRTTILAVEAYEGQGCLKLAAPPAPGASGGGVFYHGRHIANHWLRGQVTDCKGNLIDCYGKAAVNRCELPLLFTAP